MDKIMNTLLYGAVIGDISGSPYEGYENAIKTKDYKFIRHSGHITDDTIMTVAVADALLSCEGLNEISVKNAVVNSMQRWGRIYPNAGYGHRFANWLMSDNPQPYKSFGNGAAMRVSAVALIGLFYGDLDLVRRVARWTAEVTHNHPEGVKSAEAVASAIFLARNKTSKSEIKSYVEKNFGYDLSRTLDEIRPNYRHETSAQKSVPEAIISFLEAENFEDAIRNAVSLGGDADTLAAIAGSIAEAFFGIPEEFIKKVREKIPYEMLKVIDEVNRIVAAQNKCVELHGNERIDLAMRRFYAQQTDNVGELIDEIHSRILEDGCFIVAMQKISDDEDNTNFAPINMDLPNINHSVMSVFTNFYEFNKAVRASGAQLKCVTNRIDNLLENCAQVNEKIQLFGDNAKMGLIINPCSEEFFTLTADLIDLLVTTYRGGFNVDKSKAYKNLVECAKKQYPVYDSKVKITDADKQRTRDFADTFNNKQDFWDALKSKGLTWTITSKDNTTDMWARNALSKAIACGFDPNDALALFAPVVNGVNICDEINLYTYWQGFGYAEHLPKIKYLLVAQDWGNFFNEDVDSFKAAIEKMNAGEKIFYPFSLKSTTDKNLIELFKILDRDITKPCDDVFFTNFCLGYRLGNEGGGMTKKLMMRDAKLFRALCEILEPENILCLGRITSECVYEALTGESSQKVFIGNAKNYNNFLDNHPQMVLQYGEKGEITSNFYPLAHCGGMGTANRPLDKQYNDWAKISDNTPLDDPIEWWWKSPANEDALVENTRLAVAVASSFNELDGKKRWDNFISALSLCSKSGGYVLVPVHSDSETFRPGDFQFSFMENTDGENVLEIFATRADIHGVYSVRSGKSKVLFVEMREFFKKFLDGEIPCKEMLLNICGKNMALDREIILSLQ